MIEDILATVFFGLVMCVVVRVGVTMVSLVLMTTKI